MPITALNSSQATRATTAIPSNSPMTPTACGRVGAKQATRTAPRWKSCCGGNVAGLPEIVEPAQSQTNADEADVPAGLEGATTEYLYDLTQEYYQVISETTTYANGTSATTAYVYGLERIAAYSENGVTRYVYDGRGSVAQAISAPVAGEASASALPDISVQVQTFSYTAYGEQMGGVKVSGFTYNAEAYDAADLLPLI